MHRLLARQLRRLRIGDGPPTAEQWRDLLERIDAVYTDADRDRYTNERALDLSSAEMRARFVELQQTQQRLIEASRKVGMADVAAGVLHNVGNVLNSVNTSTALLGNIARSTTQAGLGKCLTLLQAQAAPGAFLDGDPKGKKVLPYLIALDETLQSERAQMRSEIESLAKNVEHLKRIVSQQLAAAKSGAGSTKVVELVDLAELFADATQVVSATLDKERPVKFVQDVGVRVVETDRHKLLQIVTNLMANARDAVEERPGAGTVRFATRALPEDRIAIEVSDDGCGISKEILDRIFTLGFTTKTHGHGFGLHGSACAAIELGGALSAASDGRDCGSTFRVVLPTVARPSKRSNTVRLPPRIMELEKP